MACKTNGFKSIRSTCCLPLAHHLRISRPTASPALNPKAHAAIPTSSKHEGQNLFGTGQITPHFFGTEGLLISLAQFDLAGGRLVQGGKYSSLHQLEGCTVKVWPVLGGLKGTE